MKYFSKAPLSVWVRNREKHNLKVLIFSLFLCTIMGVRIFLGSKNHFDSAFFIGIILTFMLATFFIYAIRYNSNIIKKTICKVEVNDSNITVETFSANFLGLTICNEDLRVGEFSAVKFSQGEYPLKDPKNVLDSVCYKLSFNDENYYFLSNYFDENLLDILKMKFNQTTS